MSSTLHLEVLWRIGVRELQPKGFGDKDVDVRVEPVVGRQILEQKHQALLLGRKSLRLQNICGSKSLPENRFPATIAHASGEEKQRIRTVERLQSHLTRQGTCPTDEWCSRAVARESEDYSSIGRKTADNRRRVLANACEVSLKGIMLIITEIIFKF
jgi:hypothetical protein